MESARDGEDKNIEDVALEKWMEKELICVECVRVTGDKIETVAITHFVAVSLVRQDS